MIWWHLFLWIAFGFYTLVKTIQYVHEAHYYDRGRYRVSVSRGLKGAFFEDQSHFTLYDIIRLPFILPSIVIGTAILLLREGIWQFFPFLRKIFGFKLFKFKK